MIDVSIKLFILGMYVLGLIYFTPSRGTEWVTDVVDRLHVAGKCHSAMAIVAMVFAVVLWPITQLAYAIHIEWKDSNTPS